MTKQKKIYLGIITLFSLVGFAIGHFSSSSKTALLHFVFWISLFQGTIAMIAILDLIGIKWIQKVKRYAFVLLPLLLYSSIRTIHFSSDFFYFLRDFLLIFASLSFAFLYIHKNSEKTHIWAKFYLISYLAIQTFIAYKWLMIWEAKFTNPLFVLVQIVESLYLGACTIVVLGLPIHHKNPEWSEKNSWPILSLCILWGYLLFSNWISLWYSNIPAEHFLMAKRWSISYVFYMGQTSFFLAIFLPFFCLCIQKFRKTAFALTALCCSIATGIFLQKWIFLLPSQSEIYSIAMEMTHMILFFGILFFLEIKQCLFIFPQENA